MVYDFDLDEETRTPASDEETPTPTRSTGARRRPRRRRSFSFWVGSLILVLIGAGAAAVLFGWSPGDSSNDATVGAAPSTSSATTTTAGFSLPSVHSYPVSDGVNIRSGPGTTFANIGTVQKGFQVLVVCTTDGQTITGPGGPTNQWVRVLVDNKIGYITAAYVDTGPAIGDPSQIVRCPA